VTVVDGVPRFASDPPLFERVEEVLADAEYDQVVDVVTKAFESYRDSLQTDRRLLLDRYRFSKGGWRRQRWHQVLGGVDDGSRRR